MKVIKTGTDSAAAVIAAENYSQIIAGSNSIGTDTEGGNFILGPVSFSSQIDSIKVGGIFRFNPILASGLPSTMITPISTLTMDPPIKNLGSMSAIAAMISSVGF